MPRVTVTADAASLGETLELGRYSLGQGGVSDEPMFDAHVGALQLLRLKLLRLFVQEYFHVYPAHGVYHWDSLDRCVDTIRRTGARPLMAITLKPKVLFPVIDPTLVHPTDYAEWEELVAQMVTHYRQRGSGIEYWEVFNEPDIGEIGGCPGLFTPEDYCTYYEHTARAIRRADPNAKVGGPALSYYGRPHMRALVEHCATRRVPLDFVSWHGYSNDPALWPESIAKVKALLAEFPQLACETIIDEWNVSLRDPRPEPGYQPCFLLESTRLFLEHGLSGSCFYHIRDWPMAAEQWAEFVTPEALQSFVAAGNLELTHLGLFDFQGIPRPSYFAFRLLSLLTGRRMQVTTDSRTVRALAAYHREHRALHVLLWNFAVETPPDVQVTLTVKGLEGNWRARRIVLDCETPGVLENDRLKVKVLRTQAQATEITETFPLPAYGISLLFLKQIEGRWE